VLTPAACVLYVAPCQPGYHSSHGLEPCAPCAVGSFQNESQSTECILCPSGAPFTSPSLVATSVTHCYGIVILCFDCIDCSKCFNCRNVFSPSVDYACSHITFSNTSANINQFALCVHQILSSLLYRLPKQLRQFVPSASQPQLFPIVRHLH